MLCFSLDVLSLVCRSALTEGRRQGSPRGFEGTPDPHRPSTMSCDVCIMCGEVGTVHEVLDDAEVAASGCTRS